MAPGRGASAPRLTFFLFDADVRRTRQHTNQADDAPGDALDFREYCFRPAPAPSSKKPAIARRSWLHLPIFRPGSAPYRLSYPHRRQQNRKAANGAVYRRM